MRLPGWWLPSTLALLSSSCAAERESWRAEPPAAAAPAGESEVVRELELAPGEAAELRVGPDGRAGERLAAPAGTERYVLIVASTRFDTTAPASAYELNLGEAGRAGPSERLTGCSLSSEPWRGLALGLEPAPAGEGAALGASRQLLFMGSEEPQKIDTEVISTGASVAVLRDTTHPTTLDAAFAEPFRKDFEELILPRSRQVFGGEPDIDGNGRIELVFSRLTRQRGVAFFSACDMKPELEGCPGGNRGELLYLTPPDAIAPPYNSANAIKEILAHELSHLLHFNRKVLRNQLPVWADGVYAAEGIGALAQDVVGYQAGNLYVAKAGLDGIDGFSLADVLDPRARAGAHQGVLRGGAYLFFRYLYDRAGGDEAVGADLVSRGGPAFLRALLDAPEAIPSALPRVARAELPAIAMDFFTALALSDRDAVGQSAPANACFGYLPVVKDPVTGKQRGANLFAAFHGQRMQGPASRPAASADGELLAGGVEYLTLDAEPGRGALAFSLRLDPASAPRVRVARWR